MVDASVLAKIAKIKAERVNGLPDKDMMDDDDGDNESAAALFKLIIIGDTGVGKSCLLHKLTEGELKPEHTVTIGVEFGNYALMLDDKSLIKLQIWDTAGEENFRSVTKIFYRNTHAVILCYPINS